MQGKIPVLAWGAKYCFSLYVLPRKLSPGVNPHKKHQAENFPAWHKEVSFNLNSRDPQSGIVSSTDRGFLFNLGEQKFGFGF